MTASGTIAAKIMGSARITPLDPVLIASLVIELIRLLAACYRWPEDGAEYLRASRGWGVRAWWIRRRIRTAVRSELVVLLKAGEWDRYGEISGVEDAVVGLAGDATAATVGSLYREVSHVG